jgi:hypothetical protein
MILQYSTVFVIVCFQVLFKWTTKYQLSGQSTKSSKKYAGSQNSKLIIEGKAVCRLHRKSALRGV